MKNIYLLAAALFCSAISAQNVISFEAAEGYTPGNINNQNGWTVTETSDGFLTNQIITDNVASVGTFSFKNAHVTGYQGQWYPIFGVSKSFSPALDYKSTTISYDFMAPEQGGADFEFAVYNINEEDDVYDTLFALGFENRGYIYIFPEPNFVGFTYATATWVANQWYNLKVEINENTINYYLNNNEIHSGPNTSKVNIDGLNFLHNNYGGSAYYDNIQINGENLAVSNTPKGKIAVYPNPVKSNLNFSLPNAEKIAKVSVHTITGKMVVNKDVAENTINLSNLKPGVYIVTVTSTKGVSYTSKFIKE